jgi:hypothetical protein
MYLFPLHPHKNNIPMLKLRMIRKADLLNRFNTSSNKSMTSCKNPMPITSSDMSNIGLCYPQFLGITKEMMSQGPQVADMEYQETI